MRDEVAQVVSRLAVAGPIQIDDGHLVLVNEHLVGGKVPMDSALRRGCARQLRPEPPRQIIGAACKVRANETDLRSHHGQICRRGIGSPTIESVGVLIVQGCQGRAGSGQRLAGDPGCKPKIGQQPAGQPLEGDQTARLRATARSRDPEDSARLEHAGVVPGAGISLSCVSFQDRPSLVSGKQLSNIAPLRAVAQAPEVTLPKFRSAG